MIRKWWCLALGSCLFTFGCVGDPPEKPDSEVYRQETPDFTPVPNEGREIEVSDAYAAFRSQALEGSTQSNPNLEGDKKDETDKPTIQGVIVESGLPDSLVAVYAKSDGSMSRYDSKEEEFETAPDREEVKNYIQVFVAEWYEVLPAFEPAKSFPFPQESVVRCFLITDQGVLTSAGYAKDLDHEYHPLFRPHSAKLRLVNLLDSESE